MTITRELVESLILYQLENRIVSFVSVIILERVPFLFSRLVSVVLFSLKTNYVAI